MGSDFNARIGGNDPKTLDSGPWMTAIHFNSTIVRGSKGSTINNTRAPLGPLLFLSYKS